MTAGLRLMKSINKKYFANFKIISKKVSRESSTSKKKKYGSGSTALIFSEEEMGDIKKIVKLFEESRLLIKSFRETTKNEAKKQK